MRHLTSFAALALLTGCTGSFLGMGQKPLVKALDIDRVAVYQAVEVPLMAGFQATNPDTPVIAGRDALVRVFVDRDDLFIPRQVEATLWLESAEEGREKFQAELLVDGDSSDGDLGSTFNFTIPGDLITPTSAYAVELRETSGTNYEGYDEHSMFPVDGMSSMRAEIVSPFEVVLVPIRYQADGSGRVPDTSEAQVQAYQDLLTKLYPSADITVSVGETVNWNQNVGAFDQYSWGALLQHVMGVRYAADEDPNTYYYGIFNARPSLSQFCNQGCILGLSITPEAGDVWGRASVGVGFTGETSVTTMVHEVGHANGREHAPCGLYGQPSDRGYPYDDAELGHPGYDILEGELISATESVDMMSYCEPIWISDYTYTAIHERMEEVDSVTVSRSARLAPEDRAWTSVWGDPGNWTFGYDFELDYLPQGEMQTVEMVDEYGDVVEEVTGYWYPYDHLEGGMMMVPQPAEDVRSVRMVEY